MRKRSTRPHRAYAAIPNAAMRDASLSIAARGLLALLMTYSDDWTFRVGHLQEIAGVGRDKLRDMLKELQAAGYVVREAVRAAETGKLKGTEWVIIDDPTDPRVVETNGEPDPQLVVSEEKTDDNRPPENTSIGDTDRLKNRPPVKPTAGKHVTLRKPTLKKKNNKNPQPPSDEPPAPKPSLDDAARMWVEPVKAGKSYVASSISMPIARRMLHLELVTSEELKKLGVAH